MNLQASNYQLSEFVQEGQETTIRTRKYSGLVHTRKTSPKEFSSQSFLNDYLQVLSLQLWGPVKVRLCTRKWICFV